MTKVAFGHSVNTRRFVTTALHPQLIKTGRCPLGPGQYNPKPPKCNRQVTVSVWKRKLETEEFSKYLGFRNQKILDDRKFWISMGGPGSYDVTDYTSTKRRDSVLQNVGFGKEPRFKTFFKDDKPPPGTHILKTPRTKFNTKPEFEWDGFVPRFKNTEPSYLKAPNRYTLPEICITKKIVTKRGPYDCFTGPRDGTTIKNYFSPPSFQAPEGYITAVSQVDYLLHNPIKRRCGKFLQAERFPPNTTVKVAKNGCSFLYRLQNLPGPGHYDLQSTQGIRAVPMSKYPFNNSKVHARPPPSWKISPGPERYKVRRPRCSKIGHASWVFKSKLTREIYQVEEYNAF